MFKTVEDTLDGLRRDADTFVFDLEAKHVARWRFDLARPQPDITDLGKLDSVGQKIEQDLADTQRVAQNVRIEIARQDDFEPQPLLARRSSKQIFEIGQHLRQIDCGALETHSSRLDLG